MAERRKSLSSTSAPRDHDQAPEHRAKRARLTRSTSGHLTNTDNINSNCAAMESDASSSKIFRAQDQKEVLAASAPQNGNQRGTRTQIQTPVQARTMLTSRLPELLDVTGVSAHEDIAFRFGQIARSLMHDHLLVVSNQNAKAAEHEYELLEVECYLRKEGHEDPFAHGTPEQREAGKWYFHRAPQRSQDPTRSATSLTGYRGGTRKGVDLTFGGPVSSTYFSHNGNDKTSNSESDRQRPRGGILFRSIRRLADGTVISGPSLLVDELLRVCGCTSITDLVNEALATDTSAFLSASPNTAKKCSISIRPRRNLLTKKPTVYSSPRIGLDLSHPGTTASSTDPRVVFVQKPYRFFMHPDLLTANGRSQTFLGIYKLISEAEILNESGVLNEVSRLTGIKRASVEKYATDFRQGKTGGRIESFIGPAGKGASSSPSTYLKMMGTLEKLAGS